MSAAGATVIDAQGLTCHYGHGDELVRAVDRVDLVVAAGKAVSVMGPSGCGTSTLLHVLSGLSRPTAGTFHVAGETATRLCEAAWAGCAATGSASCSRRST